MQVKTKILLVICGCAILFLGMVAVWRTNEQKTADTLQQGLIESQNRLVSSAIESSYALPVAFSLSFTYWDDMVNFVLNPTKEWGKENLDPSLDQYASDACIALNLDAEIVYKVSVPEKKEILAADLGLERLVKILHQKKALHFVVNDRGRLYDVSGATINKTNDPQRTGKVYGYLLIVNAIDASFLKKLEKSTSMRVREVSSALAQRTEGYLTLTKALPGLDGKDVGYLSFAAPSKSVALLKESSNRSLVIVALFALTIVFALFATIVGWINRPLNRLGAALVQSSSQPLGRLLLDKNEFGELARQVSVSFERKRQLELLLAEKTAAEEALKFANESLETRVLERTRELEDATASLAVENAERRLAEIQLTEARNLAEHANEAKSRLLANMSHEFRTPLNNILGFADVLTLKIGADPKLAKYTANISESGRRLEALLENMLTLAEGETSPETNEVPCDVADVLKLVEESAQMAAKVKAVHIEALIDSKLPLVVARKAKLTQVLLALTGNAVKYCYQGGLVIVRAYADQENHVVVEISDNGIGLSTEMQNKIFEQFIQAEDDKERAFQGAGLGLSVAKHLMDDMGGKIWVESGGEGLGCKFSISIRTFSNNRPALAA